MVRLMIASPVGFSSVVDATRDDFWVMVACSRCDESMATGDKARLREEFCRWNWYADWWNRLKRRCYGRVGRIEDGNEVRFSSDESLCLSTPLLSPFLSPSPPVFCSSPFAHKEKLLPCEESDAVETGKASKAKAPHTLTLLNRERHLARSRNIVLALCLVLIEKNW